MGKGDARRPTQISDETFAQNMARWQTPKPKKEPYVPPPILCDCKQSVPMQRPVDKTWYCGKCRCALPSTDGLPTGEQPAP